MHKQHKARVTGEEMASRSAPPGLWGCLAAFGPPDGRMLFCDTLGTLGRTVPKQTSGLTEGKSKLLRARIEPRSVTPQGAG